MDKLNFFLKTSPGGKGVSYHVLRGVLSDIKNEIETLSANETTSEVSSDDIAELNPKMSLETSPINFLMTAIRNYPE